MKLQVEITRQDFLDFNMHHYIKHRLARTIVTGLAGLVVLMYFSNKDETSFDWVINLVTAVVYMIIFSALIYFPLRNTRKIPAEGGAYLGIKQFDFAEEGILFSDKDSSGRYNWSAVKKLTESKKAFYLYVDNNMAVVIPKRSFSSKAHLDSFRQHIQERTNLK